MHTMLKSVLAAAVLAALPLAHAADTVPPVPAITTALNTADPTVSTAPLPAPQPQVSGQIVVHGPNEPVLVPTPVPTERVSRAVQRERDRFDREQRAQIAEYVANARQAPTSGTTSHVGAQTVYAYRPGAIYTVYSGVGRITDIALQPGEQLTGPVQGGDTVRWLVEQVTSGSDEGERVHIIIKPMDAGLSTDVFIPTNRRTYMLNVRSVNAWHMPSVAWTYPMDTWKRQQAEAARRESVIPLAAAPESLRFNYDIDAPRRTRAWAPVQVFDDGKQTYIRMPANLNATDAPALFVIENGEPLLVNYRVRGVADGHTGPTYVVDRVFDRAELRVGAKHRVTIRRR